MADKNQGEGDRESARRYNDDTKKFVKDGKVEKAVRESKEDPEAEKKGRERAKEFDPQVPRDYSRPEKDRRG